MGLAQEYIAVAVAVELARRLARRRDVVTHLGVHLGEDHGVRVIVRLRARVGDDWASTRGGGWLNLELGLGFGPGMRFMVVLSLGAGLAQGRAWTSRASAVVTRRLGFSWDRTP